MQHAVSASRLSLSVRLSLLGVFGRSLHTHLTSMRVFRVAPRPPAQIVEPVLVDCEVATLLAARQFLIAVAVFVAMALTIVPLLFALVGVNNYAILDGPFFGTANAALDAGLPYATAKLAANTAAYVAVVIIGLVICFVWLAPVMYFLRRSAVASSFAASVALAVQELDPGAARDALSRFPATEYTVMRLLR